VDEAGRGPLVGAVVAGAVVLDPSNPIEGLRDSKKLTPARREFLYEQIMEKARAWGVGQASPTEIDDINILQATQKAMHKSITSTYMMATEKKALQGENAKIHLLVDGNYFNPYMQYNKMRKMIETIPYTCIEGGDNKYTSIAAASILAKVERDKYIELLCEENPELVEHYGIDSNKGYGSKKHMDGIKQYGITKWHRKTFGICKNYC
jgi:ribonuclease HII